MAPSDTVRRAIAPPEVRRRVPVGVDGRGARRAAGARGRRREHVMVALRAFN